jgi:hypothetical protein
MRLNCPACGAEFTLDVLIAHDGAREALVEAMGMNLVLGKLLVQYLGLFRPAKRQLTMDRVASILKELAPDIKAAQITRHGRVWAVPLDDWKWALEEIVAKKTNLTLPLKSHGYLYQMLVAATDKVEARQETRVEERRQFASLVPGQVSVERNETGPVRAAIPEAARVAMDELKSKNRGK